MKLKSAVALSVGATMLLPACATITRGTSQEFEIVSEPPEANVESSSGFTCVTPCKLKLKRKPGFDLTISKPGYETQTVVVESKMSTGGGVATAGNAIFGGLIGAAVDGSNGAMNDLKPNPVTVTLVPLGAAPAMEAAKAADQAAELAEEASEAAEDAADAAGEAAEAAEAAAEAASEAVPQ